MEEQIFRLVYEVEDRHWWFRGRRAVIEALLDRIGSQLPPRILDAGCGTGRNLQLYATRGQAEGIDPSPDAVEFCRRRGLTGVLKGDAQAIPFEDGRFGLVAATDVLEHVADDSGALREMRRVAAPGAHLLLTIPAYHWLWSKEDERLGHFRRYALHQVAARAAATGWRPIFGTYFNAVLLPAIAAVRLAPARVRTRPELDFTPSLLDGPLSIPMRLEARVIRAGGRIPVGVSAGLVCRRS